MPRKFTRFYCRHCHQQHHRDVKTSCPIQETEKECRQCNDPRNEGKVIGNICYKNVLSLYYYYILSIFTLCII